MRKDRIKKLQDIITKPLLVKKKENLLYLTGRSFLRGYLLVYPSQLFLQKGRNSGPVFFGDGLEKVEKMKSDRLKHIGKYLGRSKSLLLEDVFSFAEADYLKKKVPGINYKVLSSPVDQIRAIKEPEEIKKIAKSMKIVEKVFFRVKRQIHKKSWTEAGLAEFIKQTGLRLGADDVSFDPIVASGANAATPHHIPSAKKLKHGESIIIDMGFKHKEYCSDFTRTIFIKKISRKMEQAYRQTELAYLEALRFVSLRGSNSDRSNPRGIHASTVYKKAVEVLAEKNLDKYFIHNLGHGTGLEIHELPNLSPQSKDVLVNGNVFSVEPGVYIPRLGGIRIEDLVYLSGNKLRKFIFVSTKLEDNIL